MSTHSTRDVAQQGAELQNVGPVDAQTYTATPESGTPERRGWWARRTGLEKVGVVALGVASTVVGVALAAPRFMKALAGGGLTGAGAWLLREGFSRKGPGSTTGR